MIYFINYRLNSSIYVATGGHWFATRIQTDIQLIVFDWLASWQIQFIVLTLMISSKAHALELRMITRTPTEMIKHWRYLKYVLGHKTNFMKCLEIWKNTCIVASAFLWLSRNYRLEKSGYEMNRTRLIDLKSEYLNSFTICIYMQLHALITTSIPVNLHIDHLEFVKEIFSKL